MAPNMRPLIRAVTRMTGSNISREKVQASGVFSGGEEGF